MRELLLNIREQWATFVDGFGLFVNMILRFPHVRKWRWREISQATTQIAFGSMPIISVATAFAGLVVTGEIAWHMNEALHTIQMVPGFTGQFILRELGIAIPAMLLVAKVGASITAEVGTMRVTDQIDALKLLRIDPISYLVFPRFIGCIFALGSLTLVAIAVTVLCAWGMAVVKYNFGAIEYFNALRHFVTIWDVLFALIKGMVFGAVIPIVSCAYGFRCKGGAEGVGTATTNSVISSTICVITLDFILTFAFQAWMRASGN
jgi:phospholipid/cholesterol/gamma-HCH transport system permease protein